MIVLLLVAEETVLAGVRVERRDGDPRRLAAGQGPHRPVGETDLREDGLGRQELEDPLQRDVQRDVDDAQPGPRRADGAGDSPASAAFVSR